MYSKQFKIVKIIDSDHIVINGGTKDGVTIGQKYQIFGKEGDEVTDPETKKSLGHLQIKKAVVEVTSVMDKMAICESNSTNDMRMGMSALSAFQFRKSLNVNMSQVSGGLSNDDETINVGDEVFQVPRTSM